MARVYVPNCTQPFGVSPIKYIQPEIGAACNQKSHKKRERPEALSQIADKVLAIGGDF